MPRYQDSGRPRGYAHVDFKKEDGVVKAVALSGQYMKGRYLNVQKANEPKTNTAMPPPSVKPPGRVCVCVCVCVCVLLMKCGGVVVVEVESCPKD